MRRIVDTAYGADADGNRGVTVVNYEIDSEDEESIREQIAEYLDICREDIDPDDEIEIVLFDPVTEEDVYLTVNIRDYNE